MDERPSVVPESLSALGKSLSKPSLSPAASLDASSRFFDGSASRQAASVGVPGRFVKHASAGLQPAGAAEFPGELMGSDGAEAVPGSVFGWKPFKDAPDHGLRPLDALARWYFGREDTRFSRGFEDRGAESRGQAKVFFYGEKHSDKGLIAENMALLAKDMARGGSREAIVLVEGYLGPDLHGSKALRFLETRGLDVSLLEPGWSPGGLQVRSWEDPIHYNETSHYSLAHHMELLNLNLLMHGDRRGLGYYVDLVRQAARTIKAWREMRRHVVGGRNKDLDAALGQALAAARASGATVHVIAGAEHLVDRPLLADAPLLGSARLRKGLRSLLGGLPYWSSKPADSR